MTDLYEITGNPADLLAYVKKVEPRFRTLGDRDKLVSALFVTVRENMTLSETIETVQSRCTELLNMVRNFNQSKAMPGLGWDCPNCKAFNGDLKERLSACRCCDAVRPQ